MIVNPCAERTSCPWTRLGHHVSLATLPPPPPLSLLPLPPYSLHATPLHRFAQVPWDPLVFQYGSECDAYGRIKTAGYTTDVCKVHRSWDMKMVMNITDDMPYDVVKEILDADWKIKNGRNNWREKEIDPEEQEWRTAMKLESREYLMEKWKKKGCNLGPTKDKVTHKLVPTPCHKPWPYCPNCPTHLPDCLSHTMSRNDLKRIQAEKKKAFKSNPKQPIPLADFKKRKQGKA